jgi:hypothetical protein
LAVASYATEVSSEDTVPRTFGADVDPHDKLGIRTAFDAFVRLVEDFDAVKRRDRRVVLGPGQLYEKLAKQRAEWLFNPTEKQATACLSFAAGIRLRLRVQSVYLSIDTGDHDLDWVSMAVKLTDSVARMCRLIHDNRREITLTDHQKILVSKLLGHAAFVGKTVAKRALSISDQEVYEEENYVAKSLEDRFRHDSETENSRRMLIFMTISNAALCFESCDKADELTVSRLTYEKGRIFDLTNLLIDRELIPLIIEARRKENIPTFITPDEDVDRYVTDLMSGRRPWK